MKKYLILMSVLILSFFAYQYVYYSTGFYLHEIPLEEIQSNASIKEKQIFIKDEAFVIKGVRLSSSLPNHNASDYEVDEATYAKWIQEIYDMGANTICVATLMDDDFYNAFYAFNVEHSQAPIYLLQGIRVSDYGNNTPHDAYDRNFYDVLKADGKSAIDILHGRKNIVLNQGRGLGYYRKDISQWVLGILNWSMVFYVYSVYSVRKYRESKTVYTDEGADCV